MKTRESGMPNEKMWSRFFSPEQTLAKLGLTGLYGDVVDFGCGYGTFTVPAARIVRGIVQALDIEADMVEATRRKAEEAGLPKKIDLPPYHYGWVLEKRCTAARPQVRNHCWSRKQRRQDIHMRDWEGFLDKFLRDTELPVLLGPGTVSHDDALDWAHEQYDAFAERRRLEAEAAAEVRYVEDLRTSAKMLETKRKKPTTPKGKKNKKGKTKRKPHGEDGK